MFKNLTIGKKIALGFTSILVLSTILAIIGWAQIDSVDTGVMDLVGTHIPLGDAVSEIDSAATNQNLQVSLFAIHKDENELQKYEAMKKDVDNSLDKAKKCISSDDKLVSLGWLDKVDEIAKKHDGFVQSCENMIAVVKARSAEDKIQAVADGVDEKYSVLMGKIDDFLKTNDTELNSVGENCNKVADKARFWMLTVGISAVLIGSVLAFVISRGIINKLKQVINGLTEGSEQVSSAASQVSAASQSLAEGATEQAAGLEETSSSLEEMASMTKQNADNAQQANTLASEASKSANSGNEAMGRMNTAIEDIQKSSDETAKIIKVIDEIAFQTNLLALNAAVEAARAGEAGKGFAVVAEEVRNLAMRSAEAAKDTSGMIEESVKNANNGVEIAGEVSKVLEDIVQGIGKTSDLVGEIAAASQEQSQGIDQVNTAVNQMDKVTQQNAANAEESASASEELSAQAEQMNQIVEELSALVGGSSTTGNITGTRRAKTLSASDQTFHRIAEGSARQDVEKAIPLGKSDDYDGFNS